MQGDLFGIPTLTASAGSIHQKSAFLERHRVTLRFDQALMALIALLVACVLIFSFGVEKGKRLGMAELKSERAKRERIVRELSEKVFAKNSQGLLPLSNAQPAVAEPAKPQALTPVQVQDLLTPPVGKYTIQLITYNNKSAAEKEIKRLADKGLRSFVIPSGRFQQVCVDAFESRQKANEVLIDLRLRQIAAKDAYIRPIPQA